MICFSVINYFIFCPRWNLAIAVCPRFITFYHTHQVTHQVRLHLALISNMFIQFIILIRNRAAFRTCRLYVFKEVHLTVSSFL